MKKSKSGFWLFLLPSMAAFIMVILIPAIQGISYSFTDWNGINEHPNFVGLDNYIKIFTDDPEFLHSFLFTLGFSLCAVLSVNLVGFCLALLVTKKFKGANLFRGIFFMPNLIGGILLGFTWQFIFTEVFEMLGKVLNIGFLQGWLSNTSTGFIGLLIVVTWQLSGYMMIIYIAQIEAIPDAYLEAAHMDGATNGETLRKIIIPLVAPAFTIGLFLSISNSFKLFDQNLALTAGGPSNSTEMLALNIYNTAFRDAVFGRAQAKSLIFLIVVAAISLTQLYISKKKEVEM